MSRYASPVQRETRTTERVPLRQSESKDELVADSGLFRLGRVLFGSVGIALWGVPVVPAAAVAGFFAGITPPVYDFCNVGDPEENHQQFIEFSKNTGLLGAALAVLQLGRSEDVRE